MQTDLREDGPSDDERTPEEEPRWQFSLGRLFLVTTIVAVACSLIAWWGAIVVATMLGAAAGAFLAALICPLIGCDVVLDDPRRDVVKCLALGGYFVGGAWGMIAGLKWLVAQAAGKETPVAVSGGLILFFLFTVGLVARFLWSEADTAEAVVITLGSLFGSFVVLMLFAG